MKKLTKIFGLVVITVLTVIMAVCFAACDDGEKRAEWETYAGTYKFVKLEISMQGSGLNQNIEVKAGESYGGVTYSEDSMVIELKSDGKAEMKSSVANVSSESNLNWYVEDNKLLFKETSVEGLELIISDDTIEYSFAVETSGITSSTKFVLKKV